MPRLRKDGPASDTQTEHENEEVPEAPAPVAAAAAAPKWRFQVLADKEADFLDARYRQEFAIGHSWIRVIDPTGAVDSWGYWPDLEGGHGVDPSAPHKSIPGRVRHPDEAHSPTAVQTTEIAADKAEAVTEAANKKEGSPGMYNLFTYNCTTFAIEMARLAGAPVPSYSLLGIANPNSLFAGISKANARRGLDAMENPLPDE